MVNGEPELKLAVSVNMPAFYEVLQVEPRSIPLSKDVTVPEPVPPALTVIVY